MVVALAAGAWADFAETAESFESLDADTTLNVSGQWACEDADATLKVTAYGTDTAPASIIGTETNTKYLSIDTGSSKPLWRTLGSDGKTIDGFTVDAENSYVYDGLVQFTSTDTAPSVESGVDKFVLWMQTTTNEDETESYSLHVYSGAANDDGTSIGQDVDGNNLKVDFQLAATVEPNKWYRVSIKAIPVDNGEEGMIGYSGFVVFIDGVAVATTDDSYSSSISPEVGSLPVDNMAAEAKSYYNESKLFLNMTVDAAIDRVGFEGSGKIDDVQIVTAANAPAFTKYNPDAPATFEVTFAQKGLPEGTVWTAPDALSIESGKTIATMPDAPAVDGYTFSAWQYDDGTAYAAQEITAAVTLYAVYTKVVGPVAPGVASDKFTTEADAQAYADAKNVVVPNGLTGDAATTYKSFFTGTVSGDAENGYTVTFDIADGKKQNLIDTADAVVVEMTGDAVTATGAQPGFYYTIQTCDTEDGTYTDGQCVQADADGKVTFDAIDKTADAKFFKITVKAYIPAE